MKLYFLLLCIYIHTYTHLDTELFIEQTTTKTNHDIDIQSLPTYETEPVFNRHKETTHTNVNVEASKHNEIAAFSHESTTKDESLIEENLLQQLRELIEHLLCGGDRIDGDIVLEIDSIEKTLKILPQQSSLVRGELEGNYFSFLILFFRSVHLSLILMFYIYVYTFFLNILPISLLSQRKKKCIK